MRYVAIAAAVSCFAFFFLASTEIKGEWSLARRIIGALMLSALGFLPCYFWWVALALMFNTVFGSREEKPMNEKGRDSVGDVYEGKPISKNLRQFAEEHPAFKKSLKLVKTERFQCLNFFLTSKKPIGTERCEDQVLGIFYLDKHNLKNNKLPFFKQDYIVNVGASNERFVAYTALRIAEEINDPGVRPICEFFRVYGEDGKYYHKEEVDANGRKKWEHHYNDVEDLPCDPVLRIEASHWKYVVESKQE